jgi:hypothetical protein
MSFPIHLHIKMGWGSLRSYDGDAILDILYTYLDTNEDDEIIFSRSKMILSLEKSFDIESKNYDDDLIKLGVVMFFVDADKLSIPLEYLEKGIEIALTEIDSTDENGWDNDPGRKKQVSIEIELMKSFKNRI